jgi:hypothetical protein
MRHRHRVGFENQIITERLIRVARVCPWVAMVIAEVLEADERELPQFAHLPAPEDALVALHLVVR